MVSNLAQNMSIDDMYDIVTNSPKTSTTTELYITWI